MFAYCNNSPAVFVDRSGYYPVLYMYEAETKKASTTDDGSVTYTTTIHYYPLEAEVISIEEKKISIEFTYSISSDGIVSFDNISNDALLLLNLSISSLLASEIETAAKQQVPGALESRTNYGLTYELIGHGVFSMLGIMQANTNVAEMGSLTKGSIGYDYNAIWFEKPLPSAWNIAKSKIRSILGQ